MKIYSKSYPIRLTFRCEKAWKYLKMMKLNPSYYLREGGEKMVIDKANEFYFKVKTNKDDPDWLKD